MASAAVVLLLSVTLIAFLVLRRRRSLNGSKRPEAVLSAVSAPVFLREEPELDVPTAASRASLFFRESEFRDADDPAPQRVQGAAACTHNPMRIEAHRHAFAPTASRPHSRGLISPPPQDEH